MFSAQNLLLWTTSDNFVVKVSDSAYFNIGTLYCLIHHNNIYIKVIYADFTIINLYQADSYFLTCCNCHLS